MHLLPQHDQGKALELTAKVLNDYQFKRKKYFPKMLFKI